MFLFSYPIVRQICKENHHVWATWAIGATWHCNNYINGCFYLIRVFTYLEFLHRFIGELEYIADYFGSDYVDVLESRHYPFNSKLALMTYISNFLIRPAELGGTGGMCPLFFAPQI